MKPKALNTVWVVMQNEWFASISAPAFWYGTLITPVMLVAIYSLFHWILDENPKDAWLKEEYTKNWQFILDNAMSHSKQKQSSLVNYAVLDLNGSFAEKIRANIERNDSHLFMDTILDMDDNEFGSFSNSVGSGGTAFLNELERVRQITGRSTKEQIVDQLLGYFPFDVDFPRNEFSNFRLRFDDAWVRNQETIKDTVPTLSLNFFRDITPIPATEEAINSLLASSKISGYFVIPENVENENEEILFVTKPDTSRGVFLDLVNWYRTIATDVLRQQRFETEGIDPQKQRLLLNRVYFATADMTVDASNTFLSDQSFHRFFYLALPIFMYVVLMASAGRLVANIVEEKSTKLAECLLANLSPAHLLDGKLWGTAMISLSVMVIWAVVVPMLFLLVGRLNVNVDPTLIELYIRPEVIGNFLLFLFLVYAFFGYFFVGFTSLFSRVNNAINVLGGTLLGIGFVFVFPAIFLIAMFPSREIQDVLSFVPVTMPFVMVARSGTLPDWPVYCVIVFVMVLLVFGSRTLSNVMFKRGISDETRISLSRRKSSKHPVDRRTVNKLSGG